MKQAIIAIEDRKFFQHWGINLQAYPPALFPVLLGKRARGASTITQQLAKNLFLTPKRSIIRKIREATSADVVASGGAGTLEHFYEAVQAGASILLAASVFHFNLIGIRELKDYLRAKGVPVTPS